METKLLDHLHLKIRFLGKLHRVIGAKYDVSLTRLPGCSVSVNGDSILMYRGQCAVTETSLRDLSADDRMAIIGEREMLQKATSILRGSVPLQSHRYLDKGMKLVNVNVNLSGTMSLRSSGGFTIDNMGPDSKAIFMNSLPNNLKAIFLVGDKVAFVYKNRSVIMKPIACLSPAENRFLSQLESNVEQVELELERADREESQIEAKIDSIEGEIDHINGKVDRVDQVMESINDDVESIDDRISDIKEAIDNLKEAIADIKKKISESGLKGSALAAEQEKIGVKSAQIETKRRDVDMQRALKTTKQADKERKCAEKEAMRTLNAVKRSEITDNRYQRARVRRSKVKAC